MGMGKKLYPLVGDGESNLEIPTRVSGWLEEVEKVKKDVDNIPSNNIGCFNVKRKYLAGRNALRITEDIERLIKESSDIIWSDAQIPLGRVDSKLPASTSTSTSVRVDVLKEGEARYLFCRIAEISAENDRGLYQIGCDIVKKCGHLPLAIKLIAATLQGCYNLVIDDGVLKNMVKLEELYMIAFGEKAFNKKVFDRKACCFTDNNCNELAERSEHLFALEFEFIGNNAHLKNMAFEKLIRFKLSVGCYYSEVKDDLETDQVDMHSYQNSLKLITDREELLKSKINELFKITDALYLQVNDMNTLEDVDVESPHPQHPPRNSSFYNLRFLVVSECAELKYLFTPSVATNLSKLEYLKISGCATMVAVIHTENNGSDIIKFLNLKCLHLDKLPKLLCFCNNANVIELPQLVKLKLENLPHLTNIYPSSATSYVSSDISCMQSLFNKEDATPKLEKLIVTGMENLKEIWPPQFSISNLCLLRELIVCGCDSIEVLFNMDFGEIEQLSSSLRSIIVEICDSLVKLFSCNPFPFLNNLQELEVRRCSSIQVLFGTDLGRAGKIEEKVCSSSLRSIVVKECNSLVNLLPRNPMPLFNNLEELEVENCASIEVLFNIDMGSVGEIDKLVCSSSLRIIKVTSCKSLVKLFSCNPFPLFNNLQELEVKSCGSIQVLFGTDLGRARKIEEQVCSSSLRSVVVEECDSLVNLLSRNPMPLFNNLEELEVKYCASIEVIFDIDMGCVGETDKVSSSRLRSIYLRQLGKLREAWRIKDGGNNLIHGFEAVESITIKDCERFENIITPATTNINMRALKEVSVVSCGRESERNDEMVESKQDQEIDVVSIPRKELNDDISKVAFPSSYLLHTFHHLHKLELCDYKSKAVKVIFEIMSPSSRDLAHDTQQPLVLPYLEELELSYLERMSYVWKCNWNEFLILRKPQSQSSFHNLTTITMYKCDSIKYLFSSLMAKLLSNLKNVVIWSCDGIEEVVSNRDDEDASIYSHTTTTFFPHLDILKLRNLINFKCIGGNANGISTDIHDQLKLSEASWSLCQYAREISIRYCDVLSSVIPWYAVGQMQKLQVMKIKNCISMTEVFETQEINNKSGTTGKSFPRLEYITMLKLPKLKILKIQGCDLLKHVFTFSTLESLAELEELEIKDCEAMKVIVMKERKNEFIWPALEKVVIGKCPQITVFTYGRSTAPRLNFINTSLGKHSVECGLNFHVTTTSHQALLPSYESTSSYHPTPMEQLPWSFHNLVEMGHIRSGGQTIFSSNKLLQLQKLETVHLRGCKDAEIFDSQTVAEIPNLRQVDLAWLTSLKYIWKSKQGTVLKFPNLTRLSIFHCDSLEYVFTCSMVGSILQLQELDIYGCRNMKVIVKGEEECDGIVNAIVVFPCLKSLKLAYLRSLEGFCLGKEAFEFPSLDTLQIRSCSEMTVFTKGDLSTPKLYAITSNWGRKYNIHNRLNSFMNTSPRL
uniref:Disease resistance protein At4g27190-like leucine-rich repeats domain-containing protein n=1 Tax=Tanacetum cinerariifolium TaxID=118510 RepID=A0A6L2MPN0_TANCI|nr:hypothetical protein [Tanacetum cinerariifolium]